MATDPDRPGKFSSDSKRITQGLYDMTSNLLSERSNDILPIGMG